MCQYSFSQRRPASWRMKMELYENRDPRIRSILYATDQLLAGVSPEFCPDCDHEWPARFGKHNCNYTRRVVHINAIVVEPATSLSQALDRLTGRMESEICRAAQSASLAGEGDPYRCALGDIDHAIGALKRFRSEMQWLAGHAHRWSDDDYCSICGADGRA